jgi:hypothetical protein
MSKQLALNWCRKALQSPLDTPSASALILTAVFAPCDVLFNNPVCVKAPDLAPATNAEATSRLSSAAASSRNDFAALATMIKRREWKGGSLQNSLSTAWRFAHFTQHIPGGCTDLEQHSLLLHTYCSNGRSSQRERRANTQGATRCLEGV